MNNLKSETPDGILGWRKQVDSGTRLFEIFIYMKERTTDKNGTRANLIQLN